MTSATMICPLCSAVRSDVTAMSGLELDRAAKSVRWSGVSAPLSPQSLKVLAALMVASPYLVSEAEMIDVLWGTDPHGGPLGTQNLIKTPIHHIRKALRVIGAPFEIRNAFGLSSYRLCAMLTPSIRQAA